MYDLSTYSSCVSVSHYMEISNKETREKHTPCERVAHGSGKNLRRRRRLLSPEPVIVTGRLCISHSQHTGAVPLTSTKHSTEQLAYPFYHAFTCWKVTIKRKHTHTATTPILSNTLCLYPGRMYGRKISDNLLLSSYTLVPA